MNPLQHWAQRQPGKIGVLQVDSGATLTYGALHDHATRLARWLIAQGLESGDHIAILLDNDPRMFEIAWAAQLAGLYYTPINNHLTPVEAAYLIRDCDAKILFVSEATLGTTLAIRAGGDSASDVRRPDASLRCVLAGAKCEGFESYESVLACDEGIEPLPARPIGRDMLYSSGTTGRPKGVRRPLVPYEQRDRLDRDIDTWKREFGFDDTSVYLSAGPFYHAAPLRWTMRLLTIGASCVALGRFDAERALETIERYRVTHAQWVPTMFVRMLALPESTRSRYDLSSMQVAVHAAAPCSADVKDAMYAWWGDILHEYYGGSEAIGLTSIGPQEWKRHRGSVGRPALGAVHILDDNGRELPPGQPGSIWFSGVADFVYHNDPEKTRTAYNDRGWATYGDFGHLDAEGYLFVSDRRADLILSGGVNVYPFEIETALLRHPAVADAGVIGVRDSDLGEVPLAIVELRRSVPADAETAQDIVDSCRDSLGGLKLPRRVVFSEPLPRSEAGKLLRRELKARYRDAFEPGFAVTRASAVPRPPAAEQVTGSHTHDSRSVPGRTIDSRGN